MALQSTRARRLFLPWDDAGIEANDAGFLRIPDDVNPVIAWLVGQGQDKTHLLQADSAGNLKVVIGGAGGGATQTQLVDSLSNPITGANPMPVSEHNDATTMWSAGNYVNVNGTGGTNILTGITSSTKITLLQLMWYWIHVSTTYPQQIHWWMNLIGDTSATVYKLYEGTNYLTADPGSGPITQVSMPFPKAIDLSKIGNGTETFTLKGFNDTQQNQAAVVLHGYR